MLTSHNSSNEQTSNSRDECNSDGRDERPTATNTAGQRRTWQANDECTTAMNAQQHQTWRANDKHGRVNSNGAAKHNRNEWDGLMTNAPAMNAAG